MRQEMAYQAKKGNYRTKNEKKVVFFKKMT